MRPLGSAKVLEARRRSALNLLTRGLSLNEAARTLGCAPSSVMRWRDAVRRHGPAGLAVRVSPGRPPKLRATERRRLVKILLKGALAQGYTTDLWTTSRIAVVIRKTFRVDYHPDHIGRLLHQLGWTHQKPETRALERDEAAIERWTRVEWPGVKKRQAAGRPSRLRRRVGLPADPERPQDVGAPRPDADHPPSLSAGQNLGDLRRLGESGASEPSYLRGCAVEDAFHETLGCRHRSGALADYATFVLDLRVVRWVGADEPEITDRGG